MNDSKTNSIKQLWSNLNRVCSAKKRVNNANTSLIDKILVGGIELSDPVKIADSFNDYFCNIGPDLVKNILTLSACFTDFMGSPMLNTIVVDGVAAEEVLSLISSLKCKKSCGADNFGASILKENALLLSGPLVYLYNLSLTTGIVPDKLKIAKVVSIFKKGDRHVISIYRPISLLSVFDKLLEKIVFRRICSFFNKYDVIYKYQFGFRRKTTPHP